MAFTLLHHINHFINKLAYQRDESNLLRNSIAIRTLLAIIVCVSHQLYIFSDFHTMLLDTRLAVAAFFFISGFSISHSLSGRVLDLNGLKKFFKARFKRVYVPYIVLIVLQTLVFSLMFGAEIQQALKYFVYNIVLLNYKYPFLGEIFQFPINGSLWSLKWEVMCYILSPLLFVLSLNKRSNKSVFIVMLLVILASSFLDYVHTNKPLFLVFIFFVGMRLYFFHAMALAWITTKPILVAISFIGYALLFICGYLGGIYLGIIVVYYLLNHFELDKWMKNDISYSIYIVHFPMAVAARKWMGPDPIQNPIYLGLLLLITLLFAYVFTPVIEEKFSAYLFSSSKS
jgi:peptidoglycan/LPS O-acetylase OafA/YrhL